MDLSLNISDFVAPGAAALIAVVALWMNRRSANERAALDFIERFQREKYYIEATKAFYASVKSGRINELVEPNEKDPSYELDVKNRRLVLDYLNQAEIAAVGMRRGTINERFYQDWIGNEYIKD